MNEEKLKELPKIDLILAGSPCFTKGTRVITGEGYKNIEDIKIGDEVLTHKNRYRKVLDIGGKYSSVCKIKAQGIIETTTTENHPYYIRSKNKKGLSEPIWKEVKEIKKGDYLGIPIIQKEENPYNLSEEQCWLLGRYVADGHIRKEKRKERKNSYYYQVVYLSFPTSKTRRGRVTSQISGTLDKSCNVCVYHDRIIRKLGIEELERLQTLPAGYTDGVSNIKRRNAIGNGWTVDVIAHILKELK